MASIIIVGAGIIGCSTAYYLSEAEDVDPKSIHLIESSPELFASASGKSGGFLAGDWFSSEVAPLGELSFRLHRELADKDDGRLKWKYSTSTGTSYAEARRKPNSKRAEDWLLNGTSRAQTAGKHEFRDGDGPAWLARADGDTVETIGKHGSVAQVDPLRLSQHLLDTCLERGVQLHQPAKAVGLDVDAANGTRSVIVEQQEGGKSRIPCSKLLITAGAWTGRVFEQLFPSSYLTIPISSLAGHSLVLRSPRWTSTHESKGCHAVFSTMRSGFSPEIFSRVGGDIYVAGLNDSSIPLPEVATDAKIDADSIEQLKDISRKLLGSGAEVDDLEIVREGLCFRPVTPHGLPVLTQILEERLGSSGGGSDQAVYVAAGHGPWGIALSLGTGKVMADLIRGQKTTVDISGLGLD